MFLMSAILNISLGIRHAFPQRNPVVTFTPLPQNLRGNATGGIYRAFQLNGHKSPVSFKLNNHRP